MKTIYIFPQYVILRIAAVIIISLLFYGTGLSDDNTQPNQKYEASDNDSLKKEEDHRTRARTHGFIDEDGDGFNDLLPDNDGDGIPNSIDPDFRGMDSEDQNMHQYMNQGSVNNGNMDDGQMNRHGESGQFGPNDSTGHGGQNRDSGPKSDGHHNMQGQGGN